MNIVGLQVLGPNPNSIAVAPPGKLEITYGKSLRITTNFQYRGPAIDITLYGSIGERRAWIVGGFVEKISAEASFRTPSSPTFVPVTASVDIPITSDIDPGAGYDIYCKIREYPEAGLPEKDDVITITGIRPTFELLEETIYPYAYIYDGPCEVTTITFKTDPFLPSSWATGKLAAGVEYEVRKAGGRIMEMRVYCDKSPLFWTDWRIETVTPVASGISLWWLGPAILLALAIVLIVITATLVINPLAAAFNRKPDLEQAKPGWHKDTLIKTIQDSEEYWERVPTAVEALEGMSEPGLREYLDSIAEEEIVPKGVPWGAIALVGVLGLGAVALASAALRRKE